MQTLNDFPSLTATDFTTSSFSWFATFHAYRRGFGPYGDHWLMCFPAEEPSDYASAALILDEECLFEMDLRTPADLNAAVERATACIAERTAQAEAEDFNALLARCQLSQLFE